MSPRATDPKPAPRPEPASAEGSAPSRTRWLDLTISVLLAISIGAAMAAATPALLQAGGLELPVTAAASAPPVALPHRPPEILGHADDEDFVLPRPPTRERSERATDDPRGPSREVEPLFPPFGAPSAFFDPDDDEPRLAVAVGLLKLRVGPALDAPVRGTVSAGQEVRVLIADGEWAFVEYARGSLSGWAKRSEIAVR